LHRDFGIRCQFFHRVHLSIKVVNGHDARVRTPALQGAFAGCLQAEIRTTHMTGLVTDMGIEVGRLVYWNWPRNGPMRDATFVRCDRQRLALLASLLGSFFFGGLAGAIGFKHIGFVVTVPLAALLVALAAVPLVDDVLGLDTVCGRRAV
ncbi:hypothetical protein C9I57_26770, partial [Trinickia symbiotica]